MNSGYIIRVSQSLDVGPLGNNKISYEGATYWMTNKAPNYFDSMSLKDVYQTIKNITFRSVTHKPDSLDLDFGFVGNHHAGISSLKLSGSYLVEEIIKPEAGTDVGPIGGAPKRAVEIRCYYFIPELSN